MKLRTIGLISTLAFGLLAGPLPSEALAKEGCFGGFRRSICRRHGC